MMKKAGRPFIEADNERRPGHLASVMEPADEEDRRSER